MGKNKVTSPSTIEGRLDSLHKGREYPLVPGSLVVLFRNLGGGYGTPKLQLTPEQEAISPALIGALHPIPWSNYSHPKTEHSQPSLDCYIVGIVAPQVENSRNPMAHPLKTDFFTDYLTGAVHNILRNGVQLESGLIIHNELARTLGVQSSPYSPREMYGAAVPKSTYLKINDPLRFRALNFGQKQASSLFLPLLPPSRP